MRLLYIVDRHDNLPAFLLPFFREIRTHAPDEVAGALETAAFDAIVLNIREYDVMEIVKVCQHRYGNVPVAAVLHSKSDPNLLLRHGVEGMIAIPYAPQQVSRVLNRLIGLECVERVSQANLPDTHNDRLTSLFNSHAMQEALIVNPRTALLLIDIDNFDLVNSLYGMHVGDALLEAVARALQKHLLTGMTAYRLNSDEFAILCPENCGIETAELAEQIRAFFEQSHFDIEGYALNVSVSIGISSEACDNHFQRAKIAVKEAKDAGKNSIVRYCDDSAFLQKQRENLYWINEVRSALEEERLITHYQPIYDNRLNKIVKYESLCRLVCSSGNIIPPGIFLPPAQLGGLTSNITRAVIDSAFKKFSASTYEFSINVTREDFKEGYLLDFLMHKCRHYGIAPGRVFIEIVETISFHASEGCIGQIQALSAYGFRIAIDDFGVESSNYSRLLNIKADYLKIDGRFIRNVDSDPNSRLIVENIVDLAAKIGAKTIAEFVNSASVFKTVSQLGVDYSQGYFVGHPQNDLYETVS